MRIIAPWIAFLSTLFALVGLCGLFASYAASIPLERAVARSALLDQVAATATAPDGAETLRRMLPMLGSLADPLLNGPGTLAERVAAARGTVVSEQRRESASLSHRVRLMLAVVTVLAAVLGAGILALVRNLGRPRHPATQPGAVSGM